ncbi:MAG TPA: hypothetical protein VLY21_01485 [Nitrososphaerales archaeon]|nr:hypothetical protein [Nitrososphaerales archaeon]HUK75185.1 hypothetical protein [Nitrososphaerales archaeon]
MSLRLSFGRLVAQLYEGSLLEAVLIRLIRLACWILIFTPLILVPIWYLFLAPSLGPVFGPVFAPLLKP